MRLKKRFCYTQMKNIFVVYIKPFLCHWGNCSIATIFMLSPQWFYFRVPVRLQVNKCVPRDMLLSQLMLCMNMIANVSELWWHVPDKKCIWARAGKCAPNCIILTNKNGKKVLFLRIWGVSTNNRQHKKKMFVDSTYSVFLCNVW